MKHPIYLRSYFCGKQNIRVSESKLTLFCAGVNFWFNILHLYKSILLLAFLCHLYFHVSRYSQVRISFSIVADFGYVATNGYYRYKVNYRGFLPNLEHFSASAVLNEICLISYTSEIVHYNMKRREKGIPYLLKKKKHCPMPSKHRSISRISCKINWDCLTYLYHGSLYLFWVSISTIS